MTSSSSPATDWLDTLRALGRTPVDAIVRVDDPLVRRPAVEQHGLEVRRVLRLVRGLAVHGPAEALVALANESWVVSIEPDHPVHTMTAENGS